MGGQGVGRIVSFWELYRETVPGLYSWLIDDGCLLPVSSPCLPSVPEVCVHIFSHEDSVRTGFILGFIDLILT